MVLVRANLRAHSRKICQATSNSATSLGEAEIGQHITPCDIILYFVTVCTMCYWCSFRATFLFYCTQLRFVQLSNKAYDDDDDDLQITICTQWRSQKLCAGADPRVEAPKAQNGVGSGDGCPLPSRLRGLGSVVSYLSEIRASPGRKRILCIATERFSQQ